MVNYEVIDKEKNIAMLSFSTMQVPVYKFTREGYVSYGTKNEGINELLRLYEEHEEHGAIISAKANYLYGEGFKAKDEANQEFLDNWLKYANRYSDWKTIDDKAKIDFELFNASYLQVITDLAGNPKEFYHLQYANCRLSECKTELYYCEDWFDRRKERKTYKIFDPDKKEVGVFFILREFYKPTKNKLAGTYPKPQYIACVKSISTDVNISTFNDCYVGNGFSAGTLITFFQDEPKTQEAKSKLKQAFLNTYSSPDKAGSIVLAWAGKGGEAPKIESVSVDDLDKKFEFTSKRCLDKIIRGHNVTNPELFGVKTEGQLGTRVSLKESYELMLNTYTKPRQKSIIKWREQEILWTTGQKIELEINQLEAIGLDLANDGDLTLPERRAIKGYETAEPVKSQAQSVNDALNYLSPLVATKVLEAMSEDEIRALASLAPKNAQLNPDGTPMIGANGLPIATVNASSANDSLKGLSAADNSDIKRIIRDYQKGATGMNEHVAVDRIMSYGITKDKAEKWLGIQTAPVQMKAVTAADFLLAYFASIDTSSDLELELVEEAPVHFHSMKDAAEFEAELKFKKLVSTKKESSSTGLLSGLLGKIGIGKSNGNNPDEPIYKTEILTKYKYALRPDAPALLPGSSSREFCTKMLALDKEFTFEQIDSARVAGLSNGFPELDNIFDFRGGFYTKPGTNETDPFCRHYWKAITYKVKTKL